MKEETDSLLAADLRSKRKARKMKGYGFLLIVAGIFVSFAHPAGSVGILGGLAVFVAGRFLE